MAQVTLGYKDWLSEYTVLTHVPLKAECSPSWRRSLHVLVLLLSARSKATANISAFKEWSYWTGAEYRYTIKYHSKCIFSSPGMCVITFHSIWVSAWWCAPGIQALKSRFRAKASLSYTANPGLPLNLKVTILSRVTDCKSLGSSGLYSPPSTCILGICHFPWILCELWESKSGPCARKHFTHWDIP